MAACTAAKSGHRVLLLEKNAKLGKKLYITGKGRCNLTNDCPPEEFLQNVVRGERFLRGAAYRFPASSTMTFMEEHGLVLKTERGNRVFPASDRASDVTKTLERACRDAGVTVKLNCEVKEILTENGAVRAVLTSSGDETADAVILATGGLSYPSTGSTGDGYRFAKELGHTVNRCVPSLVGLEADGVSEAQGISVKNAVLTAKRGGKVLFSELGELLFTHYGISGPLVLSLSAIVNRLPLAEVAASIDFKPALDEKKLDERLLRDLTSRGKEQIKSVMRGLLPAGITSLVLREAEADPEKRANAVTKEERGRIVCALKAFPLRLTALRGFSEAVVTSGGVDLKEIDPVTMESKKVKGLFFCGEVLDCDAFTGGFNLQIAFSTGFMAGKGIK